MSRYGLYTIFKVQPGKGDALVSLLLQAAQLMDSVRGCHSYIVNKNNLDANAVFVFEVWDSKEDHDNSFNVPGCKQLIAEAIPLLAGKPENTMLDVKGGKGV